MEEILDLKSGFLCFQQNVLHPASWQLAIRNLCATVPFRNHRLLGELIEYECQCHAFSYPIDPEKYIKWLNLLCCKDLPSLHPSILSLTISHQRFFPIQPESLSRDSTVPNHQPKGLPCCIFHCSSTPCPTVTLGIPSKTSNSRRLLETPPCHS